MIKKPIITINYNISRIGVKEQLQDQFTRLFEDKIPYYKIPENRTKDGKVMSLSPVELWELSSVVYTTFKNLPAYKDLINYLDSINNIMNELNRPLTWITPKGIKIYANYRTYESLTTQAKFFEHSKPVTISIPTNKLNKRKNKIAFMPNLIH
uniref:DNA-directed RNA polymerase C-terminal domain-containing protein n=1 Tax=Microbotryum lychnidis-dioicae TaxID=288795 RepID=M1GLC7_9BASI|nr:hypothetical protein H911_mgp25 [Microbotryum lychnidis-dioicae]YP_007475389.1 hypothetical protein H911_mgp15 [Microbotryum lychnidis-dioicae]AGE14593.1 hypothetical protein [Microbotryum lychnidis-dioicae]AGE14603.1 hypothetical protein [Microbotryum lychnidis-dioicae]